MKIELNPRLFNPLHWHLMPLLSDPKIRYIYIEGGSSAAKTAEICNAIHIDMTLRGYSVITFRRFHVHIRDSVYNSFKLAGQRLMYNSNEFLTYQQDLIRNNITDKIIRFKGLDDEENIKGIEDYDIVFNNEWSQFTEDQWSQQRKRLRGRPNQKFICDWNPISANLWQYKNWLDIDDWIDMPLSVKAPTKYSSLNTEYAFKRINKAGNSVWLKVTYRDNFWITGHPSGKGGFVDTETLRDFEWDRLHKPNFYRVYANGERGIMRTGGEFWKQFNDTIHVKPLKYEKSPVHISLDENVNPYVTVSIWQYNEKNIRQIDELPCRSPDNNAPKAAKRLVSWLNSVDHKDMVYIYGDPSASRRSTVDANSSSFYDKFIDVLTKEGFKVVSRVRKSAPEVALSAAFINDIYEHEYSGYSITISDKCKISIDDYSTVKEDTDGSMKKPKEKDKQTGVSYEPIGHFSDAKRYFITTILSAEFDRYKSKGKRRGSVAVNE